MSLSNKIYSSFLLKLHYIKTIIIITKYYIFNILVNVLVLYNIFISLFNSDLLNVLTLNIFSENIDV